MVTEISFVKLASDVLFFELQRKTPLLRENVELVLHFMWMCNGRSEYSAGMFIISVEIWRDVFGEVCGTNFYQ